MALFNRLSVNKMGAIFVILCAILVKMVLVAIVTKINAEPIDSMLFANLLFLMF